MDVSDSPATAINLILSTPTTYPTFVTSALPIQPHTSAPAPIPTQKRKYTKRVKPNLEPPPTQSPHSSSKPPPSAMSLIVWNCQGLGNPWTVRGLWDLLRVHKPHLVFLAETKCSASQIEVVKRRLNLFGVCVNPNGRSGGLALLWQKSVEVQLQSFSHWHVDVSVKMEESGDWWPFTGIYGEPNTSKRVDFWKLLCRLHEQSRKPWLCAGGFNEILEHTEKEGGVAWAEWQIRNFCSCLTQCELFDLGFRGSPFTWCNNQQEPATVHERLDRAVSSTAWIQMFPKVAVRHIDTSYSDHTPLVIELCPPVLWNLSDCRKCVHFEAVWLREPDCESVVSRKWEASGVMFGTNSLRGRLDALGAHLSIWGRHFGKD
ncbi:UNVERIFIED_CONTAM: hypothetical protein Slati_2639600 [Sesamum latifolium]|uniref:Endonuclease/exonuclease/phosphatase domain-containing protein n=1 Tax=Sesamum latifolium TaxID=2727402 RepID=A0AAW2VV43_9LAMI